MNRLEIIKTLKEKEEKLQSFKTVLNDIEDYYFKSGFIRFEFDTTSYNRKYNGESINFNKKLMKEYLNHEIETLEQEIQEVLGELK